MEASKFYTEAQINNDFFSEFEDVETERLEDFLESDSFDNVFIQLSKKFPTIYDDMITERDKVMVTNLQKSKYDVNVVVVGKAHINGIKEKLKEEKIMIFQN